MMWGSEEEVPFQPRHNLHRIFTADRFFEEPDVFPLYAGRHFRPSPGYRDWQPCLGNPTAAEWAADAAINFFRENPEAVSFPIGMNDSNRYCECPLCQDLIEYENTFRNRPDASALMFTFANRVAELVEEEFPDKYLTILAYLWAENTPPFPVHRQILPYLTADRTQWYDEEFQAEDRDLMARWAEAGPEKLGIYDYFYGGSFLIPRMFWTSMEKSLNHAYELGFTTVFTEMGPTYWDLTKEEVLRRKILDPQRTVADLLTEVAAERYGAAGPLMEVFYLWAEYYWREGSQLRREVADASLGNPYWIRGFRQTYMAQLFPVDSLAVVEQIFGVAENVAKGGGVSPEQRENLEQVRAQFAFFAKYRRWVESIWNLAYGEPGEDELQAMLEEISETGLRLQEMIDGFIADDSREARNLRNSWGYLKDQTLRPLPGQWGKQPLPDADQYIWQTDAWAKLSEAFPHSGFSAWGKARDLPNQLAESSWNWKEDEDGWQFLVATGGAENVAVEDAVLRFEPGGRHHLFRRFVWETPEGENVFRWGLEMRGRLSRGAIAEVQAHFFDHRGHRMGPKQKGFLSGFSDRLMQEWKPVWLSGFVPEGTSWALFSLEVRELAEGDWVEVQKPQLFFTE